MGDLSRYWVGFNRIVGVGPARLRTLLDAFGDIERAWHASAGALESAGLGPKTIQAIVEGREKIDLDRELARVRESGFSLLTWDDAEYPDRLREVSSPPAVLYVWGELTARDRWAAAVVGTRRPTSYGLAVGRDLSAGLASAGICVVSGLARGVDAAAHKAALEANGRTIAVLGSGLDVIYPAEHRLMAHSIAENGAVISEYPLGTRPEPGNFPPRNRIISGLSLAVIIVEAGEGSGALITAHFAAEQGREVFSVPGSILSRASRGTNRLIQNGANLLTSVEDVLEALNLDLVARQELASHELPEDVSEREILEALTGDPLHVDDLKTRCGLPISEVTAALAMLELKGRVRQVGGMRYVRVREQKGTYRVE